jgi:hypothetical protein
LFEGKILDGRHRCEAWSDLKLEGDPPVEIFTPEKHGNLAAWMRAKSLNMVHRHIPADQKAAIFLQAVEDFPEIKTVIGKIKQKNLAKQKSGQPLDAGDQGGNTAKEIGKLAGVGQTAVKQVQKLRKEAPAKFEEVAKGKISAKKALQLVKQEKQKAAANIAPSDTENSVKGDRPKIADLLGIIHRGMAAVDEAKGLDLKANAVFFRVNGYRVKVMCKIVTGN